MDKKEELDKSIDVLDNKYIQQEDKNTLNEILFDQVKSEMKHKKLFFKSASSAFIYSGMVLNYARNKDVEKYILQYRDCGYIWRYAEKAIKGRWKEGEKALLRFKNIEACVYYAKLVIRGPWKQAENIILKDYQLTMDYIDMVLQKRWKKAERVRKDIRNDTRYIKKYLKIEIPLAEMTEKEILKDSTKILSYASDVIKGRWLKGEKVLLSEDAIFRVNSYYRKFFQDGSRWKEFEEKLLKNYKIKPFLVIDEILYYYYKSKKQWKEGEVIIKEYENIIKDSLDLYYYKFNVKKSRNIK